MVVSSASGCPERWSPERWDLLAAELAGLVKAAPPDVAIPAAQSFQQVFAAIELAKLAEAKRAGASDRENRTRASAGGKRTKKAASRATKRANTIEKNSGLAGDVESGELGEEQLDALADASDAQSPSPTTGPADVSR